MKPFWGTTDKCENKNYVIFQEKSVLPVKKNEWTLMELGRLGEFLDFKIPLDSIKIGLNSVKLTILSLQIAAIQWLRMEVALEHINHTVKVGVDAIC